MSVGVSEIAQRVHRGRQKSSRYQKSGRVAEKNGGRLRISS